MVNEKSTKPEIFGEYAELIKKANKQKIAIPDYISNVTGRDTKAVIWNALEELRAMVEGNADVKEPVKKTVKDPVKGPEKDEKEDEWNGGKALSVLKETDMAVIRSEVKNIKEESAFSLGDSIEILNGDILDKIKAVEESVNIKRRELRNLELLERELALLIDQINGDRARYYRSSDSEKESFETLQKKLNEQIEKDSAESKLKVQAATERLRELKNEIETKKTARDELRTRENEQYEYDLKIQQNREDDVWEDRRSKREQALKNVEESLKAFRDELDDKETRVADLQERIEKLPDQILRAEKEGADAKRTEMEEENSHKTELAKRENAAQLAALEQSIASMKADYEERIAERDALRAKLDKAYDESNKLYLQTVQSTGGIKILGGSEN